VSALADWSDYAEEKYETTFIQRERRIDNYEMNWRLIMATQLMGEFQVGVYNRNVIGLNKGSFPK
jgi:hypothetical protein